jgi:putative radical SAM-modified peptide
METETMEMEILEEGRQDTEELNACCTTTNMGRQ